MLNIQRSNSRTPATYPVHDKSYLIIRSPNLDDFFVNFLHPSTVLMTFLRTKVEHPPFLQTKKNCVRKKFRAKKNAIFWRLVTKCTILFLYSVAHCGGFRTPPQLNFVVSLKTVITVYLKKIWIPPAIWKHSQITEEKWSKGVFLWRSE